MFFTGNKLLQTIAVKVVRQLLQENYLHKLPVIDRVDAQVFLHPFLDYCFFLWYVFLKLMV